MLKLLCLAKGLCLASIDSCILRIPVFIVYNKVYIISVYNCVYNKVIALKTLSFKARKSEGSNSADGNN